MVGMVGMMGPALAGSPRVTGHRDYVIKTLLHGMTGPLAGRTYTQVMLPMGSQTDQWIANVGSYIRNEFGNTASFIVPAEVASVRAATANRKAMWTYPELEVTLPRLLPVDPTWKAMASHNTERAPSGLTLAAWTTATPQAPDMWYQVELPQATMVTDDARWLRACLSPGQPVPPLQLGRLRLRLLLAAPLRQPLSAVQGQAEAAAARPYSAAFRSPTRYSCRWMGRPGVHPSRRAPARRRPSSRRSVRCKRSSSG